MSIRSSTRGYGKNDITGLDRDVSLWEEKIRHLVPEDGFSLREGGGGVLGRTWLRDASIQARSGFDSRHLSSEDMIYDGR